MSDLDTSRVVPHPGKLGHTTEVLVLGSDVLIRNLSIDAHWRKLPPGVAERVAMVLGTAQGVALTPPERSPHG